MTCSVYPVSYLTYQEAWKTWAHRSAGRRKAGRQRAAEQRPASVRAGEDRCADVLDLRGAALPGKPPLGSAEGRLLAHSRGPGLVTERGLIPGPSCYRIESVSARLSRRMSYRHADQPVMERKFADVPVYALQMGSGARRVRLSMSVDRKLDRYPPFSSDSCL